MMSVFQNLVTNDILMAAIYYYCVYHSLSETGLWENKITYTKSNSIVHISWIIIILGGCSTQW